MPAALGKLDAQPRVSAQPQVGALIQARRRQLQLTLQN